MKRHHYRFSAIEVTGKHSAVKIPDKWRFSPKDIEEYLDDQIDFVKLMNHPKLKPALNSA